MNISTFLNRVFYLVWIVVLITNSIGATNIPWNYVLVPLVFIIVASAFFLASVVSNWKELKKHISEEKLIEILEEKGYKITKE